MEDYVDEDFLTNALLVATNLHEKQKRNNGQPYITHPIRVAGMIRNEKDRFKNSSNFMNAVAAAYLHHVIEDTEANKEFINIAVGNRVADIVTRLTKEKEQSKSEAILVNLGDDEISILIKMADRLDNLNFLLPNDGVTSEYRKRKDVIESTAHLLRKGTQSEFIRSTTIYLYLVNVFCGLFIND